MNQRYILLLLALLALAGCGAPAPTPAGGATGGASQGGSVEPVLAFTEAVVGRNRIALGLVRDGTPINDPEAKVHLRFFKLDSPGAEVAVETDATYYGKDLPVGTYVAYPTLDSPGNWGLEVQTQLAGQTSSSSKRLRLNVLERSLAPNIGDKAVAVATSTVSDVADQAQLSSGSQIDPALYQISLDDALASGKPTALLFATPAFCRTAVCGPSLDVLQALQRSYGERVNFIHVEVYKYPFEQSFDTVNRLGAQAVSQNRALTPEELREGFSEPMVAWGLQSEPWLFLIDAQGQIAARYEGGITSEELSPALERLAAGEAIF